MDNLTTTSTTTTNFSAEPQQEVQTVQEPITTEAPSATWGFKIVLNLKETSNGENAIPVQDRLNHIKNYIDNPQSNNLVGAKTLFEMFKANNLQAVSASIPQMESTEMPPSGWEELRTKLLNHLIQPAIPPKYLTGDKLANYNPMKDYDFVNSCRTQYQWAVLSGDETLPQFIGGKRNWLRQCFLTIYEKELKESKKKWTPQELEAIIIQYP